MYRSFEMLIQSAAGHECALTHVTLPVLSIPHLVEKAVRCSSASTLPRELLVVGKHTVGDDIIVRITLPIYAIHGLTSKPWGLRTGTVFEVVA